MEGLTLPAHKVSKRKMSKTKLELSMRSKTATGGTSSSDMKKSKRKPGERKPSRQEIKTDTSKLGSRSVSKTILLHRPGSTTRIRTATTATKKKSSHKLRPSTSSTNTIVQIKQKTIKVHKSKSKELLRPRKSTSRILNKKESSSMVISNNESSKVGKKKLTKKSHVKHTKLKKTKSNTTNTDIEAWIGATNDRKDSDIEISEIHHIDPIALLNSIQVSNNQEDLSLVEKEENELQTLAILPTILENEPLVPQAPALETNVKLAKSLSKTSESKTTSKAHSHKKREHTHSGLKPDPPPALPRNPNMLDVNLYIKRINDYIQKLGYHHNGEPAIRINTQLSFRHHLQTARQLIKAGENIKCLHALILGIYFTNTTPMIERFPINFKSSFNGREYKHVVLGIYVFGKFGAIGISRDPGLEEKPCSFNRLVDLLTNYWDCYIESGHVLLEIKVGGIVQRDPHSLATIPWKIGQIIQLSKITTPTQWHAEVERIAKFLRIQMGPACIRQIRPPEMVMPKSVLKDKETIMSIRGTTAELIAERTKMLQQLKAEALAKSMKKGSKLAIVKASLKSSVPLSSKSSKKKMHFK